MSFLAGLLVVGFVFIVLSLILFFYRLYLDWKWLTCGDLMEHGTAPEAMDTVEKVH